MSFATSTWAYDSPSPYPPSSPSSSDCEDAHAHIHPRLRSSLSTLPESKLRALVLKLADNDPRFQRAIMHELSHSGVSTDASTSPSTPTPSRNRKRRRTKTRRNVKDLSISTESFPQALMMSPADYAYHPGHLEEDIYEFIPAFPEQAHVVRTIAMWTCCDEDEWSPGCIKVPIAYVEELTRCEDLHPDVLPDSDVERR